MGKTQLKKEIKNYTAEQLRGLLLEVYNAKVPAREFLDYYLDPQPEKIVREAWQACLKELNRTKWSYLKFRVTPLRQQLQRLDVFGISIERRLDLRLEILQYLLSLSRGYYLSDTQVGWTCRLVTEILELADRNELLDRITAVLDAFIKEVPSKSELRSKVIAAIGDYSPFSTMR